MIQNYFFASHCILGQRTDSDFLKHTMFGFNRMRNSMALHQGIEFCTIFVFSNGDLSSFVCEGVYLSVLEPPTLLRKDSTKLLVIQLLSNVKKACSKYILHVRPRKIQALKKSNTPQPNKFE